MTFKETVRRGRYLNGLTRAALAEKLGVKVTTVSAYENGSIFPAPDKLPLLAEALNLEPEALVDLMLAEKQAQEAVS